MLTFKQVNVNQAGRDGNHPLHLLLTRPASDFSLSKHSKLDYPNVLIDRKANVNQASGNGVLPLEALLSNQKELDLSST